MHPPLIVDKHPICGKYMTALMACHKEHTIAKWWGACNDEHWALTRCLAEEKKVILASSAGTIFEWYDFYLYGSLAAIIGAQFFTPFPEATRNVFALLAFVAGFIVRPFGTGVRVAG